MELDSGLAKIVEFYDLMRQITALENEIGYKGHSERTAQLAVEISKEFNYSQEQQTEMYIGGCVHDVGKSKVPKEILICREHYGGDHPNRRELEKHVIYGDEILRGYEFYTPVVRNIVLCHHKWYDGRGYPPSTCEAEIPFEAQIMAVADSFDAMIMERPYDPARPFKNSVRELFKERRTHFNLDVLRAFSSVVKAERHLKENEYGRFGRIYGSYLGQKNRQNKK